MSLIKKIFPVLVFILVVAIAWVGFSLYFQRVDLDINADATTYTKPIKSSFDTDTLEQISDRTLKSFPVSPQEFLRLNKVD